MLVCLFVADRGAFVYAGTHEVYPVETIALGGTTHDTLLGRTNWYDEKGLDVQGFIYLLRTAKEDDVFDDERIIATARAVEIEFSLNYSDATFHMITISGVREVKRGF